MSKSASRRIKLSNNLLVLLGTYAVALLILKFGNMNPFVVAFMPCLALSLSTILKK